MRLLDTASLDAYRSLLHNRDYRRWFWSSLGSSLGDWIGLFALQVVVVSIAEPGSRLALFGLGGIMLARLLPSVLFGPFAGVVSDRFDRKRVMVAADLSRCVLFVGIAFSRDLVVLFALTFVVESVSLLYLTAKNAALPYIVERDQLTEANQLTLLVTYGPLPFGAGAAALLSWLAGVLDRMGWISVDATTTALLVNAGTFLLAGALLLRLRRVPRTRGGFRAGPVEELREGLRFIRDRPIVRSLIVGVVGVFFGAGVVITLGPEFVRSELGRSEQDWYGLMTTVGSGLLAGILLVPSVTRRLPKARLFPVTLIATAAVALATAAAPTFAVTQAAGFALGVLAGFSFVVGYTLLHERTEDETRGKTFGAFYTGTRISMFAALALAPILAGAIGTWTVDVADATVTVSAIRTVVALGGLVALFSALSAARGMLPTVRREQGVE